MKTLKITAAIAVLVVLAACAPKPKDAMPNAMGDATMSSGADSMSDSGSDSAGGSY